MSARKALKIDGKTVYLGEISGDGTTVHRFVLAKSPRQAVKLLRKEISNSRSYGVFISRPIIIEKESHND